ncbi:lectin [Micromonosporaceae bacterium Da 78-11]
MAHRPSPRPPSFLRKVGPALISTVLMSAGLAVGVASPASAAPVTDAASLVNPLLGTSNAGNTFPGADAPFGMVQWSPDTPSRPAGGNYSYADSTITGFSLNHLSGPGCNATADVPIMPTTGDINGTATSSFSHADESASAGAYAVTLGNGIKTELTTTLRTGVARFTFPATSKANLLFKLRSAATTTDAQSFTKVSDTEISGWIRSGHFCADSPTYTLHFNMVFDRPMSSTATFTGGNAVTFDASGNRVVHAKVGVSYVSDSNARLNRSTEVPGWDFDGTRTAAHNAWNNILGRVAVTGGTRDQQVVFYTALYHSLLHPNIYSDVNGQYTGFDNQIHTVSGTQKAQYATFSGWDIYRTQAQLEALVAPQQASDSAQSLVNDYAQGGFLPKWSLNQADTDVMNGDPAPIIIADYAAFGATGFDTTAAKNAMVKQANSTNNIRKGQHYLAELGYLPADGTYEKGFYGSVATQLEYATSDFAISAFAGRLGDTATQRQFVNRAQTWRNVFNPAVGFMAPRLANGTWKPNFDPAGSQDMVEGTSWQYTGMVPFNLRGLADAMGGDAKMVAYLDHVLSNFTGSSSNSSTADMGNEPSFGLPWEYTYLGRPWRTQQIVRQVQNQLWPNDPARWGVGNDDLGTMSAWYVWSAMGVYPMTPGTADLALGSPLFSKVAVTLGNGATMTINAPQAATDAPYVQSATLNGSTWNNAYLPPSFATTGGTLNLALGTTANTNWATGPTSAPPSYPGADTAPLPAAGPLTSGIAGKCADVDQAGTADGTKVQIWSCNNSPAQTWTIAGDGTIRALGKCLDIAGAGTANDTKVQLVSCNGGGAQQWAYQTATGALRNPASSRCLDDPKSSTADGTQLAIFDCNGSTAQRWALPVVTKTTVIRSGLATKCIDDSFASTTNGTRIQLWSCSSSTAQQITAAADGTLRVLGKCIGAAGDGTADNTLVVLSDCTGSTGQSWTRNTATQALLNPRSGKCLDVPNSATADGTQLQLFACNGSPAQRWTS